MTLLKQINTQTLLLQYEQTYIQSFYRNNKLILEQNLTEHNPIFDLLHSNTTCHKIDLNHATDTFTRSVQQAAIHAIPVHTIERNHFIFPPNLRYLLKLKYYYRHRYQRARLPLFHYLFQLFAQIFSTCLKRLRNSKCSSFLGSLHTRTPQFWKVARYSTKSSSSIPPPRTPNSPGRAILPHPTQSRSPSTTIRALPLSHPQYGHSPPHHKITRFVDRFSRSTTPHTSPLQLTNIYEVKRKILSLKLRSAPGKGGMTPLMLRHLSRKTLTHLTYLFNHLLRLGYFPTCWKRAKVVPSLNPTNQALILTPTDQLVFSAHSENYSNAS